MKTIAAGIALLSLAVAFLSALAGDAKENSKDAEGWISLFDGKSFGDWKPNEHPDSWKIEDSAIVACGPRSHLFYTGREFKNFELKADVMTEPGSNSGIYFHTKFLAEGWPTHGYESQVNNTHGDPVKTGSLYHTVKLYESAAIDNQWWTQHIIVNGNRVIVNINGKKVLDYIEPANKEGLVKLGEGLIALQAHDPQSVVRFKNIKVKLLP